MVGWKKSQNASKNAWNTNIKVVWRLIVQFLFLDFALNTDLKTNIRETFLSCSLCPTCAQKEVMYILRKDKYLYISCVASSE
mmetsp:Transcript_36850/g.54129  ORF Transcript_36850/g.54129 Transcript_36850/m.54129 type:complete len:82 (+) Transcript_36850:858-1103(+)